MKQVLWPKYLLGGMLRRGGGIAAAERGEMEGFGRGLRGMVGRWPDADGILQGGMSEGLRDWDLWFAMRILSYVPRMLIRYRQGPFGVLSFAQHVPLHGRIDCARRPHLLGRLLNRLDRGSGRHGTDQASWRKHVSSSLISLHQPPLTCVSSSFMQSVCIIGYTLFPLVIAALLSALGLPSIARIPVYIVLVGWSLAAGVSILGGSGVIKNRVGLAVYPLLVFYVGLGCLCFIS
jgi:protein YIPF6